jgi:dipeptidyl aminopeptidase/acylaminoacyl peptidase
MSGSGVEPGEHLSGEKLPVEHALIPRSWLFDNPVRTHARVSPDGRWLSWLAPDTSVLNVWVAPIAEIGAHRCITQDRRRGIHSYSWCYDGQHLLYLQDIGGSEHWHLYAVEITTGNTRDLTPIDGVHAQIVGLSQDRTRTIVIGLNERDRRWHDLYELDIASGKRRLMLRNEQELSGFLVDRQLKARLAVRSLPGGERGVVWFDEGPPKEILRISTEDNVTTVPIAMNAEGDAFFMLSSVGRDKAALLRIDLGTGQQQLLAEHPKADVDGVLVDPVRQEIDAGSAYYLKREWLPVAGADATWRDLCFVSRQLAGDIAIASQTADNVQWVVHHSSPEDPGSYYLLDRKRRSLDKLFSIRPTLTEAQLQPMRPTIIRSRDNLELVSYLTLPKSAGGSKRPSSPLPLVMLVHGGPWGRDFCTFVPVQQWLADRGYGVLAVNFRGSTGFGKTFVNAGDHEWGRKMQDDLLDAVAWAVREGIADPSRVAIMGESYGGYATLAALAFTPDVFCCGVDRVGVSSLETLLASLPDHWAWFLEILTQRVGDPRTDEGRALLRERSPLYLAHAIRKPLLIGQGANDPRVTQAESDQIVAAMKQNNTPVTYVLYSDEGHVFRRPESQLSWYAIVETFLATHLGGCQDPVGNDLIGANVEIREGAVHIPGIAEALNRAGDSSATAGTQQVTTVAGS